MVDFWRDSFECWLVGFRFIYFPLHLPPNTSLHPSLTLISNQPNQHSSTKHGARSLLHEESPCEHLIAHQKCQTTKTPRHWWAGWIVHFDHEGISSQTPTRKTNQNDAALQAWITSHLHHHTSPSWCSLYFCIFMCNFIKISSHLIEFGVKLMKAIEEITSHHHTSGIMTQRLWQEAPKAILIEEFKSMMKARDHLGWWLEDVGIHIAFAITINDTKQVLLGVTPNQYLSGSWSTNNAHTNIIRRGVPIVSHWNNYMIKKDQKTNKSSETWFIWKEKTKENKPANSLLNSQKKRPTRKKKTQEKK